MKSTTIDLPWFPFWAAKWITDIFIRRLSLEQQGILVNLMSIQWLDGGIPADVETLAAVFRLPLDTMRTHWAILSQAFSPHPSIPGKLINPDLHQQRLIQERRVLKGKESAQRRWGKREKQTQSQSTTDPMDTLCQGRARDDGTDIASGGHWSDETPPSDGGSPKNTEMSTQCEANNKVLTTHVGFNNAPSPSQPTGGQMAAPQQDSNGDLMGTHHESNGRVDGVHHKIRDNKILDNKSTEVRYKKEEEYQVQHQTVIHTSASKLASESEGELSNAGLKAKPKYDPQAEEIYQAYPLKVGKPRAIAVIKAKLRAYPAHLLLEKTRQFTQARNGDVSYVPHPATWFFQERFNDDPATWLPRKENVSLRSQLQSIEQLLKLHHCNPSSPTYSQSVSPEQRADYKGLLQRRHSLHRLIADLKK